MSASFLSRMTVTRSARVKDVRMRIWVMGLVRRYAIMRCVDLMMGIVRR